MGAPWSGRKRLPECDALLLHAYSIHKAGLHKDCGHPLDESTDPANEDAYEVVDDEVTCYACAAWERWREATKDRDREPGALEWLRHVKDAHGGKAPTQADLLAGYKAG